jgi:hypothetical protein
MTRGREGMHRSFAQAETFLWRNARLLDRLRFAHHFRDGSRDAVVTALTAYQNADGGFGNALEPDLRCPESQPVPVEMALHLLSEVRAANESLAAAACDWLQTVSRPDGGVPFVLPAVDRYPHAPWWEASPESNVNPTAGIAGWLHEHAVSHPWLQPATDFCWGALEGGAELGGDTLISCIGFLAHVPDRDRARPILTRIVEGLRAGRLAELDPSATGYVKKPLDFAPTPDSPVAAAFPSDLLARHLDALEAAQQEDGGWPLTWDPPSDIAVQEWRGIVTLGSLLTLRAYGRLG